MTLIETSGPVFTLPHPLVAYTFWSFHLNSQSIRSTSDVPQTSSWLAEVIFGYSIVPTGRVRIPPIAIGNIPSPLGVSSIVGATGACTNVVACDGVSSYVLGSGGVEQTAVALSTDLSSAEVSVVNGIATLVNLNLVFLSNSGNSKAMTLSTNTDNALSFGPSYECSAQWELKTIWTAFGYASSPYSILNTPVPVMPFPPGGEFLESLSASYPSL
jgi:hypothetical protein